MMNKDWAYEFEVKINDEWRPVAACHDNAGLVDDMKHKLIEIWRIADTQPQFRIWRDGVLIYEGF